MTNDEEFFFAFQVMLVLGKGVDPARDLVLDGLFSRVRLKRREQVVEAGELEQT